jgi:methyl-accepting chemotaxis protein
MSESQATLLLVFTGILAIAVFIQSLMFYGIYRSIRQLAQRIDGIGNDLMRNVEAITFKVNEGVATIKEMGEGLRPIKERLAEVSEVISQRVSDVDSFLEEATNTAREELLRIREKIESASNKAEEALEMLRASVLTPLNELNAISRGIKAGFDMFFRRRRNPSKASPQDEEMFI